MDNRSFHGFSISEDIVSALNGLEYEIPTEVQDKVIPLAIEKNDLSLNSTAVGNLGLLFTPTELFIVAFLFAVNTPTVGLAVQPHAQ